MITRKKSPQLQNMNKDLFSCRMKLNEQKMKSKNYKNKCNKKKKNIKF